MFLSIFAATCRPHHIISFLDNLAETADDLSSFEVLLKLDEGADELITVIDNYKRSSNMAIRYLVLPKLEGYYSLDVGYNELLKIADKKSYFCWLLTDEIRLKTKGWDTLLKKYMHAYADDIFRIKLSHFQLKNYNQFFECLSNPDNYALTTRKWLTLTEGWGHFWGPDSWHQCVDYYLGLCKNPLNPFGVWRSFPAFGIHLSGQEAGQGEDRKGARIRTKRIWNGWKKHSSHQAQENYFRLAQRLNTHIYATSQGMQHYFLQENHKTKRIALYDAEGNGPYQVNSYQVKRFRLRVLIGHKHITIWHLFTPLYLLRFKFAKLYRHIRDHYFHSKQSKKPRILALMNTDAVTLPNHLCVSKQIDYYFYNGENLLSISKTD